MSATNATCPHGELAWPTGFCYECADLKDQTIVGPYEVHDIDRGSKHEFIVTGRKLRTNGHMTLAQFPYRTNATPGFLAMKTQAKVLADIFCSRLNELHVAVKDPRPEVIQAR